MVKIFEKGRDDFYWDLELVKSAMKGVPKNIRFVGQNTYTSKFLAKKLLLPTITLAP